MINAIHHVSLLVSDLTKSMTFYGGVLSLRVSDKRPKLAFDGAWFDIGGLQLHLICSKNLKSDSTPDQRCGHDRHLALKVDSIEIVKASLALAEIDFEQSQSGRPAIFCRDPDGNALEFIGNS